MKYFILTAIMVMFTASSSQASTVWYELAWAGPNGYTLSGDFSFDGATAGNKVDETELLSFSIEGFLNGTTLGTFSGPVNHFNFDATTGSFDVGGVSYSDRGQDWNAAYRINIGFASGSYWQYMYLDGVAIANSKLGINSYALTASLSAPPVSAIPLPAALPLYGAGLAIMGFLGWRKRKSASAVSSPVFG